MTKVHSHDVDDTELSRCRRCPMRSISAVLFPVLIIPVIIPIIITAIIIFSSSVSISIST